MAMSFILLKLLANKALHPTKKPQCGFCQVSLVVRHILNYRIYSLVCCLLLLTSCSKGDTNYVVSDDSLWQVACDNLSGGKYKACYGPGWEARTPQDNNHYDFYEISVEKKIDNKSSQVLFSQKFNANDVPQNLLARGKSSIVKYDETTQRVLFVMGSKTIEFYIRD
jgi:hypothetical protein